MNEKKKLEIKLQAFADYSEWWPVFSLHDRQSALQDRVSVMLTAEESREYQEVTERFHKWQKIIKERAFPDLEDY